MGLVAADVGVCVIPASARFMRADLHYRLIDDERATSPIILSHRINDGSRHIEMIKQLIQEMYAENPPWLDVAHNYLPELRFEPPSASDEPEGPRKPSRRKRPANE